MSRTIRIRWAALALAIAWSSLHAQTQNEIVSTGFTAQLYQPSLAYVTPGELITLFTTPLGVPDAVATGFPLPTSLSGVSVLVRVIGASDATGYPTSLPILRIDHQGPTQLPAGPACPTGPDSAFCSGTQITVEIPTEGVCYQIPDAQGAHPCAVHPYYLLPPLLVLNVKANGVTGPDLPLRVQEFAVHFLNSCESISGPQRRLPRPRHPCRRYDRKQRQPSENRGGDYAVRGRAGFRARSSRSDWLPPEHTRSGCLDGVVPQLHGRSDWAC